MAKRSHRTMITGLDIGTTKVIALVGEVTADNKLNIIGFGSHPSRGLKRGVVVNIESTTSAIQRAVEEAELMVGAEVHSAYTGIAGSHIRSTNSHGIVAIRNNEVTQYDIDRVIDAAKAVAIPADQRIVHIIPQEFIIDDQDGIKEPIGMSGVRLEAKVHIVTAAVSAEQNIIKCVQRCGLDVQEIVLEQLASSYMLTEDEKDLGVCLIDIGGGTTDIAVFVEGAIRHSAVIPIAGDQVTNDIAVAMRTPTQEAEKIKVAHACALASSVDENDFIEVPGVARRPQQLSRRVLAEVVEARYEELFSLVLNELRRSGFVDLIPAGLVMTGGASKVAGGEEVASKIFQMPVRIASPDNADGIANEMANPVYATAVGLLQYGFGQYLHDEGGYSGTQTGEGVWSRMRQWLQYNF